jgi:hypothetical protein
MSGIGAWSFGFYHYGMEIPNNRVLAGLNAFKQALIDNMYSPGIDVTNKQFGTKTKKQTILFQTDNNLTPDGVIGPITARYLFRFYSYPSEFVGTVEIPGHLLQKLGCHESGHDPVAQGYVDSSDEGWAQISLTNHPQITQAKAWTPSFAIPWAANYLKTFFVNTYPDWDAALASYNIGTSYAAQWARAGKPSSGGPIFSGYDLWSRATAYVAGVKAMPI